MMRRLLTTALFLVAGCNDGPVNREIPYDPPPPQPDMAPDTTPPPSGNVGANETRLSASANVRPLGVDRSHNAYWVAEGSGGGAVWTASMDYTQSARVVMSRTTQVALSGDLLLGWNTVRGTNGATTSLQTYRFYNYNAAAITVATNVVPGLGATDGDWIAFADNVSSDGTSADLYLSKIDGSARTRVVAGINVGADCKPQVDFNWHMLVMSTCPTGTSNATIASVNTETAAVTTLKTGVLPGFQHRGTFFLFNDATASYFSYGQTVTALDKPLQLPIVAGKSLVYAVGKQLRGFDLNFTQPVPHDVALLTDAPVQLVASPDGAEIAYWSKAGETHDLGLVFTASGASRPIRTDFATFGGFTDDSEYLLLLDNVDSTRAGALTAVPVRSGPSRTIAPTVATVHPARASKLIYTEIRDGVSALRLIDLTIDRAPVTIGKVVDVVDFATDPDRSRVLYTRSKAPDQGLYFSAIP